MLFSLYAFSEWKRAAWTFLKTICFPKKEDRNSGLGTTWDWVNDSFRLNVCLSLLPSNCPCLFLVVKGKWWLWPLSFLWQILLYLKPFVRFRVARWTERCFTIIMQRFCGWSALSFKTGPGRPEHVLLEACGSFDHLIAS